MRNGGFGSTAALSPHQRHPVSRRRKNDANDGNVNNNDNDANVFKVDKEQAEVNGAEEIDVT